MYSGTQSNPSYKIIDTLPAYVLALVGGGSLSRDITLGFWSKIPYSLINWSDPLTRSLILLSPWAIATGTVFVVQMIKRAPSSATLKTILPGAVIGFAIGFVIPYLGVLALGLFLFMLFGILSFLGIGHNTSYAFACLCASYLVFAVIAIDTFPRLIRAILEKPTMKKILGLIGLVLYGFGIVFAIKVIHDLLWYIFSSSLIAFGGPLLILFIFAAIYLQGLSIFPKITIVVIGYIICIIIGVVSGIVFHIRDYQSAIIAGVVSPIVYCLILATILEIYRKSVVTS